MRRQRLPLAGILGAGWLVLLCGCSSSPEPLPVDETVRRLRDLGQAYGQFTVDHQRPPQNEKDLRRQLEKMKLGKPDELLRSPRDGQPFVIVWGFDVRQSGAGQEGAGNKLTADQAGAIYMYERQGSGGERYVLYTHGSAVKLTAADFAKARFFGSHKPQ
jgi:hypothetical protein